MTADKHMFDTISRGDLLIILPNDTSQTKILLCDVLYTQKMGVTLVSVSKLNTMGYAMLFQDQCCKILDHDKRIMGVVPMTHGLYAIKRG